MSAWAKKDYMHQLFAYSTKSHRLRHRQCRLLQPVQ